MKRWQYRPLDFLNHVVIKIALVFISLSRDFHPNIIENGATPFHFSYVKLNTMQVIKYDSFLSKR
jgi:hypothetical protein